MSTECTCMNLTIQSSPNNNKNKPNNIMTIIIMAKISQTS